MPPQRKSLRLQAYDYSLANAYFITIVTAGRQHLFGDIEQGEMALNAWGQLASNEWQRLSKRFPGVALDEWVTMPDHLHAIIFLNGEPDGEGFSLGTIIGAFKSTTARLINALRHSPGCPIWQRSYYDRVIRSEKELHDIQNYIYDNPMRWKAE